MKQPPIQQPPKLKKKNFLDKSVPGWVLVVALLLAAAFAKVAGKEIVRFLSDI